MDFKLFVIVLIPLKDMQPEGCLVRSVSLRKKLKLICEGDSLGIIRLVSIVNWQKIPMQLSIP